MRIYLSIIIFIFLLSSSLYAQGYKLVKSWGGFDALYGDKFHGDKEGEFHSPTDVAVDKEGFVYVVDKGNNRVQKFTKDGEFILSFGNNRLNSPEILSPDKEGNIYVVDNGRRINVFDKKGDFIKNFLSDYRIRAMACGKDYLYVAVEKSEENKILKIDYNTWKIIGEWRIGMIHVPGHIEDLIYDERDNYLYLSYRKGIKIYDAEGNIISNRWTEKEFISIGDIAIGMDNNNNKYLYVASFYDDAIIRYDIAGREIHRIHIYIHDGYGISFSKDGYLYLAGSASHGIIKFNSNLTFISEWRKEPEEGKFHTPIDMAIDSEGYIYVFDRGNYRIQKFNSNGTFITKWRTTSIEERFIYPWEIMVGGNNHVYICSIYGKPSDPTYEFRKYTNEGKFISKKKVSLYSLINYSLIKKSDIGSLGWVPIVDAVTNIDVDRDGNFFIVRRDHGYYCSAGLFKFSNEGKLLKDLSYIVEDYFNGWIKLISVNKKNNNYAILGDSSIEGTYKIGIFNDKDELIRSFLFTLEEAPITRVEGMYMDEEEYIYLVGESGDFFGREEKETKNFVAKYHPKGKLLAKWGKIESENGLFKQLVGVAVDKKGNIYLSDTTNECIYKYAPIKDNLILSRDATYIYPNPTKDKAHIKFWVEEESDIEVKIYNIAGELIATLRKENTIGEDEITWNIPDKIASGVYLCQIKAVNLRTNETDKVVEKLAVIR